MRRERVLRVTGAMAALWVAAALGQASLAAQAPRVRVEPRAGVVQSTSLAEADVLYEGRVVAGGARLSARVAPFLGAAIVRDVDETMSVELTGAFSRGKLEGQGPEGFWNAGEVWVVHATAGIRYQPRLPWLYARGGAGLIAYRGEDVAILRGGSDTGILVAAALGIRPPLSGPVRLEVEVQRHGFGSVAYRREGGVDGAVGRLLVGIVFGQGVR